MLTSLLLAMSVSATAPRDAREPIADPAAVVVVGQARFTVLTPRLVRLEWAADGRFEDRASLVFVNRRLPVPTYSVRQSEGWTVIDTGQLQVRYRPQRRAFTRENLAVELVVAGRHVTWHPGLEDTGNLRGTARTLDGVKGATSLEPGLLSRDGWVVVDDSARPLFDGSDWPWAVPRAKRDLRDWYFFGHGHDYKAALGDFTQVAGRIPMPPRYAFGAWWSRYWSYTDQEFMELVRGFESHDVPLDVLVIDMDWHQTFGLRWWQDRRDQAGHRLGWSGYTWDRTLFPDPAGFLAWCEARGLKTPLNLHPASGVQPHEEAYPAMARAMGIDPATRQHVPFDITDKTFATHYLDLLHHPLERQGVDFWWLDWQQHPTTRIEGLSPTWWLNYVHSTDMERRGTRPLIFHRWGGLGNHRYQVGFSGDTESVWESLAFQPAFTATAANVGYAYWSHDIGGHMPGVVSPELYARWIQFGAFSPILRTHTTKNPDAERRIWAYPAEYARVMREAFLLRYALVPYLYTAARQTHETGVAFLRPLYYDHPEDDEAYAATSQYLFGESLLVAPVTVPVDPVSALAAQAIWLPPGTWVEWFTGATLEGPARVNREFGIDEIPVYARAGAIVAMQPKMRHTGERPVDPLIFTIFPGAAGDTRVYEDEGHTLGYKADAFAWTPVSHDLGADGATRVHIGPLEGRYPGMIEARAYELRFPGRLPPRRVRHGAGDVPFATRTAGCEAPCWTVEGDTLTTVIRLLKVRVTERVAVTIDWPDPPADAAAGLRTEAGSAAGRAPDGFAGRLRRLRRAYDALNRSWPRDWSPDSLVDAMQTGRRIELRPEAAAAEIARLLERWPVVVDDVEKMDIDATLRTRALAQLGAAATR